MAVRHVTDEDGILIASTRGKVIRTKVAEISEVGRIAQGVRLISMDEGEVVGAVAKVHEEKEEAGSEAAGEANETPSETPEGGAGV